MFWVSHELFNSSSLKGRSDFFAYKVFMFDNGGRKIYINLKC